jgi:hypothetical protein
MLLVRDFRNQFIFEHDGAGNPHKVDERTVVVASTSAESPSRMVNGQSRDERDRTRVESIGAKRFARGLSDTENPLLDVTVVDRPVHCSISVRDRHDDFDSALVQQFE